MNISELIGKTLVSIDGLNKDGDEVIFTCDNGDRYRMYHYQDCCEGVSICDIVGDVSDLIGNPILQAEERTSNENPPYDHYADYGSFTWTFYEIATIKGSVNIRWLGESNGYYSESVDFELMK